MIVGISGKSGSGKSTIAKHLVQKYGYTEIAFADALKREVQEKLPRTLKAYIQTVYPVTSHQMGYEKFLHRLLYVQRDPVTRALLQEWGTDLRRNEDPMYWIKEYTERVQAQGLNIVTPDCRFTNEMEAIRQIGWYQPEVEPTRLWKVERPGHTSAGAEGHLSETEMDSWSDWDQVFVNDSTVLDLYAKVDKAMEGVHGEIL